MKTFKKCFLSLTLLFTLYAGIANTVLEINFIENDLELALEKARRQGKNVMVDFWASWCSPCKWMDEQTFGRPEVASYLNKNFISVRVDIDNFDGMNHRGRYDVRFLPTVIILDAYGNVIQKYEESLPPSKMMQILERHSKKAVAVAPKPYIPSSSSFFGTPASTASTTNSVRKEDKERDFDVHTTGEARPGHLVASPPKKDIDPAPATPSFVKHDTPAAPAYGYSIQIGAFGDALNAQHIIDQYRYQLKEKVYMISENGLHKVLVGHYSSPDVARRAKSDILRRTGLPDAFLKKLSR